MTSPWKLKHAKILGLLKQTVEAHSILETLDSKQTLSPKQRISLKLQQAELYGPRKTTRKRIDRIKTSIW